MHVYVYLFSVSSLKCSISELHTTVHYFSFLDDPAMIKRIRSTFVGQYSLDKVNYYLAKCIDLIYVIKFFRIPRETKLWKWH